MASVCNRPGSNQYEAPISQLKSMSSSHMLFAGGGQETKNRDLGRTKVQGKASGRKGTISQCARNSLFPLPSRAVLSENPIPLQGNSRSYHERRQRQPTSALHVTVTFHLHIIIYQDPALPPELGFFSFPQIYTTLFYDLTSRIDFHPPAAKQNYLKPPTNSTIQYISNLDSFHHGDNKQLSLRRH